jgi:hypothetical protein
MNIKLHTPKSLKNGSGMSSLKQFMLSLLATTVSIALTFGTAAVIDNLKKKKEKREIVMMVMYDMYNTLRSVEKSDTMLRQAMKYQLQVAEDTAQYNKLKFQMAVLVPQVDYTETTERIFSSSIETINTVGNVLFSESVADFYQARSRYKGIVCDSIAHHVMINNPFSSARGVINIDFDYYALLTKSLLTSMRQSFTQCKQITRVSDEDLDVYCREREQMKIAAEAEIGASDVSDDELLEYVRKIGEAKKKLNLE